MFETDELHGVGPYGEAKVQVEQICQEYRDKGMCVPIIRPKSFVGPERLGVFALFYDWAKDGKNFPVLGSGNNRYQLLDVEDLCDAIYLAATLDPDKVNDVFNIGAKEFTTLKEDYQAVLDYAGYGRNRAHPGRARHLDPAGWRSSTCRRFTVGYMRPSPKTRSSLSKRPSELWAMLPSIPTSRPSSATTNGISTT